MIRDDEDDTTLTSKWSILEGDAENEISKLRPGDINCIFTSPDPPRSRRELAKLQRVFERIQEKGILDPRGSIWVHMGDFHNQAGTLEQAPQRFAIGMTDILGYLKRSEIIWHRPVKPRDALNQREDNNRFLRNYDFLMWFTQSRYGYHFIENNMFSLTSVVTEEYISPRAAEFKSGFPESIIKSCLTLSCPPGGTVLDPFTGTGTTGVVALRLGMKFVGIEIDDFKIPLIENRLKYLSGI